MIAMISHRFDGHVQLHARRRGHRLGARCCVRGVVVCVEIRFHGDGFNCAQDNLTRSQVVVPLLQVSEGRPQGGGNLVQGCVEVTDAQKTELKALTGKTSVPQVFVKGQFIGGCNDGGLGGTVPLLKSGKLQEMLQ